MCIYIYRNVGIYIYIPTEINPSNDAVRVWPLIYNTPSSEESCKKKISFLPNYNIRGEKKRWKENHDNLFVSTVITLVFSLFIYHLHWHGFVSSLYFCKLGLISTCGPRDFATELILDCSTSSISHHHRGLCDCWSAVSIPRLALHLSRMEFN